MRLYSYQLRNIQYSIASTRNIFIFDNAKFIGMKVAVYFMNHIVSKGYFLVLTKLEMPRNWKQMYSVQSYCIYLHTISIMFVLYDIYIHY